MFRTMMKSKLHHIRCTEANVEYMGSITLPADVMEEADILAGEKVQVINLETGDRFETYTIGAAAGSKVCGLNGGAAKLGKPGDRLLVISYAHMSEEEYARYSSRILFFDENNNVVDNPS